jgi:hypothetical protein
MCPSCDSRMVRPIKGERAEVTSGRVKHRCFVCGWEWSQGILDDLGAS